MPSELEKREPVMSQSKLIWRDFKKHKLAIVGLIILGLMYGIAIFADFISPYDPNQRFSTMINMAPQKIHIRDAQGWHRPFVYGINRVRDPMTFEMTFSINEDVRHPIKLFVRGHS